MIKTDWMTKVILLLIAVALWGLMLRPAPMPAHAMGAAVDMNIAQIGGRDISVSALDGRVMATPVTALKIEFKLARE